MRRFCITIGFLIVLFACEEKKKKQLDLLFESKADYEKTMILSHKEFLKKEKVKIQKFVDSTKLEFKKTGTGLQYHIYQPSLGDSIKTKEIAFIAYCLTSIAGDTLYESPAGKLQEFMVDYDVVETGLHEGIKKMRVGEKAYLILPAHLAHGITGDQAAIPSQTTLVYDIHLVAKR
ncbi:MAG: FKBP-type peptidyl-prolyl cis-trans isomerase [Flavobacteriales bacterium]|nr:FKBP-type peptidyl-prolyl cis-trans isomerase [Flavobacteriales bacterium]